jgi:hypothetical protein
MVKTDTLILRMEGATKVTIRRAADRAGETMTQFATRALEERAKKVLSKPRGLLPTYFRSLVARAAPGGQGSWRAVGHAFVQDCVPDLQVDIGKAEANKELDYLESIAARRAPRPLTDDDLTDVLAWFEEHFPRCMELVPDRRRAAFASGAADRAFHDGIDR